VKANDRVSLRVAPGQIHAVLGENGAGKSTLMKIIYGAVRPDGGEMRWDGQRVEVASPSEARALGISMVYQHFSLFDTLTAAENVWLGLDKSLSLAQVTSRIRKVAGEYGLDVDPVRPVHTLSVGEKQRVEIVRALMTAPRLLILDEPTIGLDPVARDGVWERITEVRARNGMTVLVTTHYMEEAQEHCDRVALMHRGRIRALGTPKELIATLDGGGSLDDVFRAYTGDDLDGGGIRDVRATRRTAGRLG
jgi:simple sugar transport system ATP-binding protein